MERRFSVPVEVRGYEVDAQGHLNGAVYLQYAEHARWELFRASGIDLDEMRVKGLGPVLLEITIRHRHELRRGDEAIVTCAHEWGDGKTFRIEQEIRRVDGVLSAEISGVCGILDLTSRRLVPDTRERLRSLASRPELLD